MSAIAAASILATTRLVAPIVKDLYRSAKGTVQRELADWSAAADSKAIAKTLVKIECVKTLWSPDKEMLIHDFYYPSKVGEEWRSRTISSLDDLPVGNITIQGIVGQGKSIFMRYLASTAIKSKTKPRIPIFVELRVLSAKQTLRQTISIVLASIGAKVSDESFNYLADSGRVVLLLDGFDEVKEDYVGDLLQELEYLQVRHPELQLIVSSRPGNEIQKTTGFKLMQLTPLDHTDYSPFLQRLGLDTVKRTEIVRAINKSPSHISGIIRTPLMMTLVVMVYETEREIPPTLPEFFEKLFQVVFTRHDRLKAGFNRKHHSGLSERRLQLLFEAFCFMTLQSGYGRSLTREQFSIAFDSALEYTQDCKCEVEKFRLDITKVSCLMLDEGIDLATFLHKSILEYYAASFIRHSPDDVAKLFYTSALSSYRQWSEVLAFLRDIDPYRYARDYTLREIPPVAKQVSELLARKKLPELLAFIERHQPGISASFLREYPRDIKKEQLRHFGPIAPPAAACFGRFSDILVHSIHSTIPRSLTAEELSAFATEKPHVGLAADDATEVSATYAALITLCGDKEFWLGLAEFDTFLSNEIASAELLITSQEKRKLIFERKSG